MREALEAVVGAPNVRAEADDLAYYGSDRCRGAWPVAPSLIVLPGSAQQVQDVVRTCSAHGAVIVPSGGRTGLAGGATATAGEVVVSLERMHRIHGIDTAARTLRCEAGATVEAVQIAAKARGLLYPVDFAAKGSAQIGGSIATNAGGVRVLRYGGTRAWVAGLEVVLASGERVEVGRGLVKDNTGYDLRQLFIGSEGTLGIIVGATMRLTNPPRGSVVALCAVPRDDAILVVFERLQRAFELSAFECIDAAGLRHVLEHAGKTGPGPFAEPAPQHVLVEVEVTATGDTAEADTADALALVLADAQDAGEIVDAVLASTPAQAADLWSLREGISESLHRHRPHKADISVPISELTKFLAAWRVLAAQHLDDCETVIFGHVGDGNLHLNVLPPADADETDFRRRAAAFDEHSYALVEAHGGSVSAEHGIGLLKRDHLHHCRSDVEIAVMRQVKAALDPGNLFNPGKIF